MKSFASLPERIRKKISKNKETGCWEWTGGLNRGYGIAWWNGTTMRAHRVVYGLLVRELNGPDELLDHGCRNPRCVNPAHLRPVTHQQNSIENSFGVSAINAAKTHCKRGHPLVPGNLQPAQLRLGERACWICYNEYRKLRMRELSKRAKAVGVVDAMGVLA